MVEGELSSHDTQTTIVFQELQGILIGSCKMVSDLKVGIKYPGKDLEKSVPNPGANQCHVVEHGKCR